jgi:nitrite reductase/ring-hydroxylating ferredoxin subunit/uncharacterized membrane protein
MGTGNGRTVDPAVAARNREPGTGPLAGVRLDTWHEELVGWVDGLGWLRGLSDWLTGVLGPFRERHQDSLAIELLHGGRWAGHAVHPALSDLPIGLWTSALLLDVTGNEEPSRCGLDAAGVLSAAGLVAAGATAVTGVGDWTVSNEPDRRIGLFHGLLNTAALGLQAAGLGTRLAGRRGAAQALGAASLAVTAAAAYLGGHLVFGRGVMVSRVAWAAGPRKWTRAIADAELPDDVPTGVEAEGRQILLYRHDGDLHALDNVCSHAGGLLSRGSTDGLVVTCPLHGSRFALEDGRVRRGPASQPQPVLRTRVRGGWIEVRGGQAAPRRAGSRARNSTGEARK